MASWAELLWGRPDLVGRRLVCGWLIPLLAMAQGFSAHAAWHAYGVFVGWRLWGFGLVLGWLVFFFFGLSFACWGVCVSCPPEHCEDVLCCPCCIWYYGRDKEMGLCSLLGWGHHFYLGPKSIAANELLAFLPGMLSLHLHILFPKVGLVRGCSLEPDHGT